MYEPYHNKRGKLKKSEGGNELNSQTKSEKKCHYFRNSKNLATKKSSLNYSACNTTIHY